MITVGKSHLHILPGWGFRDDLRQNAAAIPATAAGGRTDKGGHVAAEEAG